MTNPQTGEETNDGIRSYCEPAKINGQQVMIAAYDSSNPVIMVFDRYGHIFLWLSDKYTTEQLGVVLRAIGENDMWTVENPFIDPLPELEDFDIFESDNIIDVLVPQKELLAIDAFRLRQIVEETMEDDNV